MICTHLKFGDLNILIIFFFCSFGARHVTPRSLASRFLGNMVCLEGIVTKCKLTPSI